MMRSKVMGVIRAFLQDEDSLRLRHRFYRNQHRKAQEIILYHHVHPEALRTSTVSTAFKQLLMCSGYDRYFQIAKCFRDEDLRADRQPEFTQVDMEMSFVDMEDVLDVNERLIARVFKDTLGVEVPLPLKRMTWQEAMDRFGSDKPDLRFGMELVDVSEVVKAVVLAYLPELLKMVEVSAVST